MDKTRHPQDHLVAHAVAGSALELRAIAHDIRNPLAVIESSLYLVRRGLTGQLDTTTDRSVSAQLSKIERQLQLCRAVLSTTTHILEHRSAQPEPVELVSFADRLFESLPHEDTLTLAVEIDFDPPEAYFDPQLMHRALLNLLTNAACAQAGVGRITLRFSRNNDRLFLDVLDDGPGLAADVQARIGVPSSASPRTGLGLTIVEDIARCHSGRSLAPPHAHDEHRGAMLRIDIPRTPPRTTIESLDP